MNTEPVHFALSFRDPACGTADDWIDMTQVLAEVSCSECLAMGGAA